jgi:23S rRNA (guanosine2251-2'-O)-methyltransferase
LLIGLTLHEADGFASDSLRSSVSDPKFPEVRRKNGVTEAYSPFLEMVGDPGIEPGVGRPGGVTVPCRTLQLVARRGWVYPRGQRASRVDRGMHRGGFRLASRGGAGSRSGPEGGGQDMAAGGKKPAWVVEKERGERREARETVWLFGLHAVRDALMNPRREKLRLVVTKNALDKLEAAVAASGMVPDVVEPRRFDVPIDEGSVHQGAAIEVKPLNWGRFQDVCAAGEGLPLVVLLDRVTDPHNVGAILRSAEVFGARAVVAPKHYSAPETGALAKTASGALERQPYLRVTNLAEAMEALKDMGFTLIGLDGEAPITLAEAVAKVNGRPIALVLGAEGPGLREKTRETCDQLARIPFAGAFGSLNVSNAAAVSLYAATRG